MDNQEVVDDIVEEEVITPPEVEAKNPRAKAKPRAKKNEITDISKQLIDGITLTEAPDELVPVPEPEIIEKPKRVRKSKKDEGKSDIKVVDVSVDFANMPIDNKVIVEDVKSVEEEKPNENIKVVKMIKCPKCNRSMTEHTLRYTHPSKCAGEPKEKSSEVKRRVKKVEIKESEPVANPIQEAITQPVVRRTDILSARRARVSQKQEKYQQLFNLAV